MYDPLTLDQLRALVAVVDEGSFSAAARKLRRVQSAVSSAMANLEAQLGITIWDRSTRIPRLTDQGRAVLGSARKVLLEVDGLRRLTAGMTMGVEASVSLCVDALFPLPVLVDLCTRFRGAFPDVELRIDTQVMTAVSARVLDGSATLGIVSQEGLLPGLERRVLSSIRMIPVVSPKHPLAHVRGAVTRAQLADAVQIVLSERQVEGVVDQGVLSPRTWRVADLHTKHVMLRAGLGWGNLPEHLVEPDRKAGKLVVLRPETWGEDQNKLYLAAIHRSDARLGPAHQWLLAQFPVLAPKKVAERRRKDRQRASTSSVAARSSSPPRSSSSTSHTSPKHRKNR